MIGTDDIEELNHVLCPHYDGSLLAGEVTCFQFLTDDGDAFFLLAGPDSCRFHAGRAESPTIRLFVESVATARALLSGSTDGMTAFMAGRYRSDGHLVLSQVLLYLFANRHLHRSEVED